MAKTITTSGGSLYQIAAQQFGDATRFVALMDANAISDPLLSGIVNLTIPAISYPSSDGLPDVAIPTQFDLAVLPSAPDPQPFIAPAGKNIGGVLVLPPGQVASFTVTPIPNRLQLAWTAPLTGDPPTSYLLQQRFSPLGVWTAVSAGLVLLCNVAPANPRGKYDFQVAAFNAAGFGPFSNIITGDFSIPNAPKIL